MRNLDIAKIIPDNPRTRLIGMPTELEKLVYKGPFNENINLIRNILRDYSEPLDIMTLGANHLADVFSVQKDSTAGDEEDERYLFYLYRWGTTDFSYAFGDVIRDTIKMLAFHGRAWLEIRLGLDNENKVVQVAFIPIYAKLEEEGEKETKFNSITWDRKTISFSIDSNFLVPLSLAEVGFADDLFQSVFKKIQKIPLITNQVENVLHPAPWYNFNKKVHNRNMAILRATKDIYYAGTMVTSSNLMSDFHLIYRICHFKMIKRKIIDYIVNRVNQTLVTLEQDYRFPGQIEINEAAIDYMKYYDELTAGKITIKEMFDVFEYGKIKRNTTK